MSDFFDRLEKELRGAARRQEDVSPTRRLRWPNGRRAALALAAALGIAVPASAAVIDAVWPEHDPPELLRTAPRTIIATGESAEWGKWEAFVSNSTRGQCFGLRLIDPPGVLSGSTREGCGGSLREPARIGGGTGPPRTAYFGFVPREAVFVRLEASNRKPREFRTYHPPGRDDAFFFASVPIDPGDLENARIVPLDADHRALERMP